MNNIETYRNIMSANPKIDKNYLSHILKHYVETVDITEVIETNTAMVIKIDTPVKKLFIKTSKRNHRENSYHEMSMKEGMFYKTIRDAKAEELPIPTCYDVFVSEETGEFVIVLEDISSCYAAPSGKVLTDENVWFSCAESLAKLHAAFWNYFLVSQNDESEENDAEGDRACLQSFLYDFRDKFDDKTKTILNNAMEINISLIESTSDRLREKRNVTLCNGDSHIYNFMLPVERSYSPLIVDFQFWHEGMGTGDLAHLTRVNFSEQQKKDIQLPLAEHYHKSLIKYGVTDYSWENCLRDYRTSVASMVLIPLWQYAGFGLKYEEWSNDLQGLIDNYEYMNCDEL